MQFSHIYCNNVHRVCMKYVYWSLKTKIIFYMDVVMVMVMSFNKATVTTHECEIIPGALY